MRFAGLAFAALVVAAVAFAVLEPIQVLPRIRLAPGYALTDQHGRTVTSEDARGVLTLYTFAPTDCAQRCEPIDATMRNVRDRVADEVDLAGVDLQLVTIAIDAATPAELTEAAARSGADGRIWRWVGGDESTVDNVVGAGFGRWTERAPEGEWSFDPGFVLVDGLGVVRGDYRYQTLADDADKLLRHLAILGAELGHADGPTAVAYEAAHLFLCYP